MPLDMEARFGLRVDITFGYVSSPIIRGSHILGPEYAKSVRFQIPMIAPFPGCIFGGFLYDAFIYTGESPANTFITTFIEPNRALGKSKDSSGDHV